MVSSAALIAFAIAILLTNQAQAEHLDRESNEIRDHLADFSANSHSATRPQGHLNYIIKKTKSFLVRAKQDPYNGEPSEAEILKRFKQLQAQVVRQSMQHDIAEKDHLIMEKWLVDNINDLHRELKQTENDFEHYVQVTKNIFLQNERKLKHQLAHAMGLPLAVPIVAGSYLSRK